MKAGHMLADLIEHLANNREQARIIHYIYYSKGKYDRMRRLASLYLQS